MEKRAAMSWRTMIAAAGFAVAAFLASAPCAHAQIQIQPPQVCCFCSCQTNPLTSCSLLTLNQNPQLNITFNENILFGECDAHCFSVGCQVAGVRLCPRGTVTPSCSPSQVPVVSWSALLGLVALLSGLGFYRMRQRA